MKKINKIPPHKFVIGLIVGFFTLVLFFSYGGSNSSVRPVSDATETRPSYGEQRQYSETRKQRANPAAYELYMDGYKNPEKGEVAGALSDRFSGEQLKGAALMYLGAQDRKEGKPPRFELAK